MIARLAALSAIAIMASAPAAAASTGFKLRDPRLDEVSGIAAGIVSPGVYYVQNDSGDSARFFALDAHTGRLLAEYHVPDAVNHDWEDLAVARDAAGVASVWLADIGDNDADRSEVEIYRVDEPRVDRAEFGSIAVTARPDVWRLRYPSGPVNAESLAVAPGGRAYVITKNDVGHSEVYAVPRRPGPRVQLMSRVGPITFTPHASLIPPSLSVLATGAALSADGTRLAVRTYADAYVWTVRAGGVAAAIRRAPTRIALPLQPQGEGICVVGDRLVVDSEQAGSAVLSVPVPHRPPAKTATPASASAAATSGPASATPRPSVGSHRGAGGLPLGWRIGLAFASIALGLVVWLTRRRRRKRG